MSASNALETALLQHLFQNLAIAGVGNAGGLLPSSAAGNLYVGLHSSSPGEAGTQSAGETAYAGYARVAVPRSSAGWTVTGNVASNAAALDFPASTDGGSPPPATHFSIGTAATGAGMLLFHGPLSPQIPVNAGVTPGFAAGALTVTAD